MRKLLAGVLCLLLAGLCACGRVELPGETFVATTQETSTEETTVDMEESITKKTIVETIKASLPTVEIKASKDDPYSHVIKWYYDNGFVEDRYYMLYDVDGNGTEVLLFAYCYDLDEVYAIQNGIAILQEAFTWDGERENSAVLFQNGTIGAGNINYLLHYYRFEEGEFKRLWPEVGRTYDNKYYRHDGDDKHFISKEEYERLKKEYEGDGQTVALDWKPLAEYGRE